MYDHRCVLLTIAVLLVPLCSPGSTAQEKKSRLDRLEDELQSLKETVRDQRETIEQQKETNEELQKRVKRLEQQLTDEPDEQEEASASAQEKIKELETELAKLKFRMPETPEPVLPEGLQTQEEPNALNPQITLFSNHLYRLDNKEVRKGGSRVDGKYRLGEMNSTCAVPSVRTPTASPFSPRRNVRTDSST